MSNNLSMSISFKKSTTKTNLNHNNRNFTEKQKEKNNHINYDRSDVNKYLVQRDLKELYETEFTPALKEYNQKQTRTDRKIDNYFDHIKDSKKTALQQEMIIQVGDKDYYENDGDWRIGNHVLEEWFKGFQERNPNLKVYNAVIHNDEASPHLHLNFVPVASGYKRGLEKQVAFDKAIKQQDPTLDKTRPFADWREKEVGLISEIMQELDIDRKIVGTNLYKDVNDYKVKKDLEREVKELHKDLSMKKQELLAHNKEINIDDELDIKAYKEMENIEVPTEEKTIFGKVKTKTEEKWTNRVIVSLEDYRKMQNSIKTGKSFESRLNTLLDTDVLKENKNLKDKLNEKTKENKKDIVDYNNLAEKYNNLNDDITDLEKENSALEIQVDDLRDELFLVYQNTKGFFKDNLGALGPFKSIFKSLVDKITNNLGKTHLNNTFKKEYDKEYRIKSNKKPEFNFDDLKRRSEEYNKSYKKENSNKKNRGIDR